MERWLEGFTDFSLSGMSLTKKLILFFALKEEMNIEIENSSSQFGSNQITYGMLYSDD